MKIFDYRTRCDAAVVRLKLSDLINTWLQPDASSNETHQPFQRLASESKTVETVSRFYSPGAGLEPGVNEKKACIFHAL